MLVADKYIVLLALCSRSGAADDTNWTFYGLQDVFMEEEFDMTSICIITEEHLEKLGIKMGQRLKFLAAQKADCTQLV